MKLYGLHANGRYANLEGPGKILHGKIYTNRESAERRIATFRNACITDVGTARDLNTLADDESLKISVIEFELVED